MPIYEYACENCGKRSSALLVRFDSPDPACPHCGQLQLHRLVSTFATFGGGDDDFGGGDDFGGTPDEFGGAAGYGDDYGGDADELGGHHGGSDDLGDDDW